MRYGMFVGFAFLVLAGRSAALSPPAPPALVPLAADDSRCLEPMCIEVLLPEYDWTQFPLHGGDTYGFLLERRTEPTAWAPVAEVLWIAFLGDCVFDRTIDLFDVIRAQDIALGIVAPLPSQVALCDTNCDGQTDVFDVITMIDDSIDVVEIPMTCVTE